MRLCRRPGRREPDAQPADQDQGWDYRLGINGVKRMQAAYQSTLVAQGAFSAYRTEDVRAVGGWPDAIGEDIVLTWSMMASRGLVQYEPCALGSTAAPERARQLMHQRSRWARGCSRDFSATRRPPAESLAKFVSGIDYLVPFLDIGYVFFWIPGIVLFIAGYPLHLLVVVDADAADHPRHLRAAAPLAGATRFRRLGFHPQHDGFGFLATCSAIGRSPRRLPCAATSNTRAGAPRRWK